MKLNHYIGIHIIASNTINITELSVALQIIIEKYLIALHIELRSNKFYEKFPEGNSIIYCVLNNKNIKIQNIIADFLISWNYSESYAYNVNVQQRVDTEEDIWNKNCHPGQEFLMPEIEWVHIYTREEKIISK